MLRLEKISILFTEAGGHGSTQSNLYLTETNYGLWIIHLPCFKEQRIMWNGAICFAIEVHSSTFDNFIQPSSNELILTVPF